MPNVPAVCINHDCGFVFQSSLGIICSGGATVGFKGCHAGPCPKCGSMGRIPDGRYDAIGASLFAYLENASDISIFKKSAEVLEKYLRAGESPNQIIDNIKKESPELQSLWDLIPKKREEAYIFIGLILTFLTLLATCYQAFKQEPPSITIKQQIINQTFQDYYSQDNSVKFYIQQGSHNETQDSQ